jgi:hypothetical protein
VGFGFCEWRKCDLLRDDQDFIKTAFAKGMIAWVDDFCAAHPDYNLDTAAFALIGALKGVRQ